ncbi:AN1-type zinc finger protein 2A isoform X3 [Balaenoptera ricei]|uniref:AN1-type zinc finger protein 2A isoform X3 n=1 Tax=Balaenoptera ricei TaxID=2746895 RepID=UPI0028BF593C|nr:AN1-type zinc finger protein 2A isoform X3 [Balaenoptera ricei]
MADVQVPVCPLCNSPVPVKKDEIPDAVVGAHMDGGCKRHPGRKKEALRLGNVKDVKSDMGVPASAVSVLVLKSRVCGLSHVVVSRAHAPGPQLTARVRLPAMRPPPGPASPALPLLLSISEPSGIPCHRTNAIMTNYLEQERVKSVPELLSQTLWLEPPDPFPAPSPPARSCCPRLPRRASEPSGSFERRLSETPAPSFCLAKDRFQFKCRCSYGGAGLVEWLLGEAAGTLKQLVRSQIFSRRCSKEGCRRKEMLWVARAERRGAVCVQHRHPRDHGCARGGPPAGTAGCLAARASDAGPSGASREGPGGWLARRFRWRVK